MKKSIILLFTVFILKTGAWAQEISPFLIGNNFWYPSSASLTTLMSVGNAIDTAGFQTIRIGGFGANGYSNTQFIDYVKQIQAIGAEPIVQVSSTKTDAQVLSLITDINVTNALNVKYWAIGNEPDHNGGGNLSATQVGTYIRRIAPILKTADPSIKIIGPDYAGYNSGSFDQLLGGSADISGKDANGNYYIDIFSWHKYNILDITGIEDNLDNLLLKLNKVNANRPEAPISWMIGEVNMHWDNNEVTDPDGYVWSFHAGHVFADLYEMGMRKGAFSMCPWSIFEGDGNRSGGDLGLFDAGTPPTGRSSYFHSMMLGQNMKQNLIPYSDNQADVKVISMSDSSGVSVMIMNKNKEKSFTYSLKLNNEYGANTALQIKVDAGIDKEVTGVIPEFATQMLSFDAEGNLLKLYTYTSRDADKRQGPTIELMETACNPAPTINFIENIAVPANSDGITLNLSGISDGNNCTQGVNIEAYSMNPNIAIVAGLSYSSCESTGSLKIMPVSAGRTTIILKLTDGGQAGCNSGSVKYMGIDVNSYTITNIPGLIECEDYFENSGLIAGESTLGTLNLGYSDAGDFVEYKVNATYSGTHYLSIGVASGLTTGAAVINVLENETELASIEVAKTGGWQVWTSKTVSFDLTEGVHTLKLLFEVAGTNIDYMIFSTNPGSNNLPYTAILSPKQGDVVNETSKITIEASAFDADNDIEKVDFFVDNNLIGTATSKPYVANWISIFAGDHVLKTQITDAAGATTTSRQVSMTILESPQAIVLPGTIEAENFISMLGIQTEPTQDAGGGDNVGYVNKGDWMDYLVNVPIEGTYRLTGRVAGWAAGSSLALKNEAAGTLTTLNIPNTGGYQVWEDAPGESEFALSAGVQTLRIEALTDKMNLNKFIIEKSGEISLASINLSPLNIKLGVGNSIQIIATSTDNQGNTLGVNPEWSVNNNGLINKYGVFLAENEGEFIVTAKLGDIEATSTITVSTTQATYEVQFYITDVDNNPINGAAVVLHGTSKKSDAAGSVTFAGITPADNLVFSVSKTNYIDTLGTISVNDANVVLNIELVKIETATNENAEAYFTIFPNPVHGNFITIQKALGQQLSIIDVSGKLMLEQLITNESEQINISKLEAGIYFIQVKNNKNNIVQKFIVK